MRWVDKWFYMENCRVLLWPLVFWIFAVDYDGWWSTSRNVRCRPAGDPGSAPGNGIYFLGSNEASYCVQEEDADLIHSQQNSNSSRISDLLEPSNMERWEPYSHLFCELFPPAGPGFPSAPIQLEPAYWTGPPPGPADEPLVDAVPVEPVLTREDIYILSILQSRQANAAQARFALGAAQAWQGWRNRTRQSLPAGIICNAAQPRILVGGCLFGPRSVPRDPNEVANQGGPPLDNHLKLKLELGGRLTLHDERPNERRWPENLINLWVRVRGRRVQEKGPTLDAQRFCVVYNSRWEKSLILCSITTKRRCT